MNPLTYLTTKFHSFFISVPVEQLVAVSGEEAQIEIAQRDHTIRREQFARHLAVAKLEAVRTWGQPEKTL